MDIPEISYEESFGLPRPDWDGFRRLVEALPGDVDLNALWTEAARRWLLELGHALGAEYFLEESANFLLLSALERRLARRLLDLGERTLERLLEVFAELQQTEVYGKFACIAFASEDAYYSYISHSSSEGKWGASGGTYFARGYTHFALNHCRDFGVREAAFVHELVHDFVNHRGLPVWVEEGITQLVETSVMHQEILESLNRHEAERLRRFWRKRGLDGFWSGESFSRSRGMDPSYALARILNVNLLGRGKDKYLEFVKRAAWEDAGDAASRAVYGCGVDEWARQFLGEGDWKPRPIPEGEAPRPPAATRHAG